MSDLTDTEVKILELAELLEQQKVPRAITYTWLRMSPVRYTDLLLKLIARPDVEADPRWTMLVHRLRNASDEAAEARAARRLAG